MNTDVASILDTYGELRTGRPLVQCITNFVSMDVTANVLNAAGASPAMVHDPAEAGEFAGFGGVVDHGRGGAGRVEDIGSHVHRHEVRDALDEWSHRTQFAVRVENGRNVSIHEAP